MSLPPISHTPSHGHFALVESPISPRPWRCSSRQHRSYFSRLAPAKAKGVALASCLWLALWYNEYPVGCEHFPPLSAKLVPSPPLFSTTPHNLPEPLTRPLRARRMDRWLPPISVESGRLGGLLPSSRFTRQEWQKNVFSPKNCLTKLIFSDFFLDT